MLESCHPRYGIKVAPVAFEPLYGLCVYDQAAKMMPRDYDQ